MSKSSLSIQIHHFHHFHFPLHSTKKTSLHFIILLFFLSFSPLNHSPKASMSSLIIPKHDYIALSSDECSSTFDLNFKDTELRLGLPGSGSPDWVSFDHDNDDDNGELEKHLVSGAKRVFSDAINGGFTKWGLDKNGGVDVKMKSPVSVDEKKKLSSSPSKEQVVGWPPVRSFRKNSMAVITQKTNEDKDKNSESDRLYIKVSMDGAPYLRKVDLKTYNSYVELSLALEKMFSGFTTGYNGEQGTSGEEKLTKGRFADSLHRSEYVLTYEDKDGDWMLVGDVPWNMFMDTCRRLRIMKSSEAVGLASTRGTTEE